MKVRVLAGLAVKIMLNEHKELGGKGKSLEGDERLFKELLALHVQESEGKMKILRSWSLPILVLSDVPLSQDLKLI